MERSSHLSRRMALATVMAFAGTFGMPTSNRQGLEALQSHAANPFGFGPDPFASRGRRPSKYKPHVGDRQVEREWRRQWRVVLCPGRPGHGVVRGKYQSGRNWTALEQAADPQRVSGAGLKGRTGKSRRAYLAA